MVLGRTDVGFAQLSFPDISQNIFIGDDAGKTADAALSTQNVFIGNGAGLNSTSGTRNTLVGYISGEEMTTGVRNTLVGYKAGRWMEDGVDNVFVGVNAGDENYGGSRNVYLGADAGQFIDGGVDNVFIGFNAAGNRESGARNVCIGSEAGKWNEGDDNIFIGYKAAETVNGSANQNIMIGNNAGLNTVDGAENTIIGHAAGRDVTNGIDNVYVGNQAGRDNNNGEDNVYVGKEAGRDSNGGNRNVYLGTGSGKFMESGDDNVYLGYNAGGTGEIGDRNVFIGTRAAAEIEGSGNIVLGYEAATDVNLTLNNSLYIENSASPNPLIYGEFDNDIVMVNGKLGINAGAIPQAQLEIVHENIGIAFRHLDAVGTNYWELWQRANTATDDLVLYNTNANVGEFNYNSGVYSATSDRKLKRNIQPLSSVLPSLMKLNVTSYHYASDTAKKRNIGFIAQEVETLFPELVTAPAEDGRSTNYLMNYAGFGVLAVKAVQEQQVEMEALKAENEALKTRLDKLEKAVEALNK